MNDLCSASVVVSRSEIRGDIIELFLFGYRNIGFSSVMFSKLQLISVRLTKTGWFQFSLRPGLVNRNKLRHIVPPLVRAYSQLGSRNL